MNRIALAISTLSLTAAPAVACDLNLLETPAVSWETCSKSGDESGEKHYGDGFKVTYDRKSFDDYYARIQKTTEVGDANRDTHDPSAYCDDGFSWLGVGFYDRSADNWIFHLISGSQNNTDKDVNFLSTKAHEEFAAKVRGITCRMNVKGKQPELKLEGSTLVIEVVPRKCNKRDCDAYQGREPSLGDFHAYVYWTWMTPFFVKNFPAFKKAATVVKRKYPSVALTDPS